MKVSFKHWLVRSVPAPWTVDTQCINTLMYTPSRPCESIAFTLKVIHSRHSGTFP